MEFLVCMLLAALFTGGRAASDIIHAVKGTSPAHLERARLKAQNPKPVRERSPYAQDKPRLRDVAAVYWGDAMRDVIDAHQRRRAEKTAQRREDQSAVHDGRPPRRLRPSWTVRIKRAGSLLWNGPRPAATPADDGAVRVKPAPVAQPGQGGPRIACDTCGVTLLDTAGGYTHPSGSTCPNRNPAAPDRPAPQPQPVPLDAHLPYTLTCPGCGATSRSRTDPSHLTSRQRYCPTCRNRRPATAGPAQPDSRVNPNPPVPAATMCRECRIRPADSADGYCGPCIARFDEESSAPIAPGSLALDRLAEDLLGEELFGANYDPDDSRAVDQRTSTTPAEGDNMTQPTSSSSTATGEAVNYETALAELDALEQAQRTHLEQAKAALDEIRSATARISDTQATYRPAAEAAGSIHQHLTALNLDPETVANTGTITDAMPPNVVDQMFAALEEMEATAQQQVSNAETALAATGAARQVIVEKYGDAHATVQGELAGDARFLDSAGTATPAAAGVAALNPTAEQRAAEENLNPHPASTR